LFPIRTAKSSLSFLLSRRGKNSITTGSAFIAAKTGRSLSRQGRSRSRAVTSVVDFADISRSLYQTRRSGDRLQTTNKCQECNLKTGCASVVLESARRSGCLHPVKSSSPVHSVQNRRRVTQVDAWANSFRRL
jgi:hypothetical protein